MNNYSNSIQNKKVNVCFLTPICRQTVFVKIFDFLLVFCFFVNNRPLKYREKIKELLPFTSGIVSVSCQAFALLVVVKLL